MGTEECVTFLKVIPQKNNKESQNITWYEKVNKCKICSISIS